MAFMEHAVTENVIAGNAMSRRAQYQFGAGLTPGPEGQMTSGIGIAVSSGTFTLIPPTRTITHTGETLTIDGVRIEFQLTPDTEAPSEMNFFFPDFGVLLIAENATASMHNILTPRGALVRDAKAWADYLTEVCASTATAPRSWSTRTLGRASAAIACATSSPATAMPTNICTIKPCA
jgi:alkyl sulfatase BDS1-like metallo-beta-lactamase superfamily hydrolase